MIGRSLPEVRMHIRSLLFAATLGLAGLGAFAEPPPPAAAAPAAALIDQPTLVARLERRDPALLVLDVRSAEEFAAGHVPGARNIAHDALGERLGELADQREREIVVYCRSGRRSQLALQTLREAGFTRLLHLDGDFLAWQAAGRPVEKAAVTPAAP